MSELIETLWNVNARSYKRLLPDKFELIETLWNVNWCTILIRKEVSRINRNIVECK